MSKPYAYSDTHQRNISLDEAHIFFFDQIGIKQRYVFRCGDPICRGALNPVITGVGYDKPKGTTHQSPNFRENSSEVHIPGCTWITKNKNQTKKSQQVLNPSTSWVGDKKFIFKTEQYISSNQSSSNIPNGSRNSQSKELPETSVFMHMVGSRYLSLSDSERRSTILAIDKIVEGTFHTVCIPFNGFHPVYQSQRIYFDWVNIIELDFVFLIQFNLPFAPDGDKNNRNVRGEIKLLKKTLDIEDAALKALLHDLSITPEPTRCFFYSNEKPSITTPNGKKLGRFEINNISHIAIIPISTIISNTQLP